MVPHQTAAKNQIDNLNEEFSSMKIEDQEDGKLYKLLSNTKWKVQTSQKEEKRKCCEKYCLSRLGGIDNIIYDLKDVMFNILASDYIEGSEIFIVFVD